MRPTQVNMFNYISPVEINACPAKVKLGSVKLSIFNHISNFTTDIRLSVCQFLP